MMKPSSHTVLFVVFFWFLKLHSITSFSFVVNSTSARSCSYDQSHALLDFNNNFIINSDASILSDYGLCSSSHPRTNSWDEGQDCCYWDGVTCDITTSEVIGLDLSCSWLQGQLSSNSSLFLLQQLEILNLSYNNFTGSEILPQFSQFQRLTYLNLSNSYFSGDIPIQISYLSNLVSLDLSTASFYGTDLKLPRTTMKSLVENLTMLKGLYLDGVDVSTVELDSLQNISSTLTSLRLSGLTGIFPTSIFHLPNLQLLSLSNLYDEGNLEVSLPTSNWSTTSLMYLKFSGIIFKNGLPSSIGNLKALKSLSIVFCKLTGSIPDTTGNLTNLEYLLLGSNELVGTIPPSIAYLTHLQILDLSSNELVGSIPKFSNLSLLHTIDLSKNPLTGTIPFFFYSLPLLRRLFLLSIPLLGGQLHPFQSRLLKTIIITYCNLRGPIPAILFPHGANQLTTLHLSGNALNGTIPSSMLTLPSLLYLYLADNQLVGGLPEFKSTSLKEINLSNNTLQGSIPSSISGLVNLIYLNLAHNNLIGISRLPWKNLKVIDLRSNLLRGPLPLPTSTILQAYFISNNSLTGDIPTLICNTSFIQVFDLSRNYFTGTIPECLGNISTLIVLDLSMNKFHGKIPNFSGHQWRSLRTLKLNRNQLEGKLPVSLVNCENLEVLDISNNNINDTFPHWLRFITDLQVLVLKSNNFHGYIHDYEYQDNFQKLRIFDISNNNFVGSLPAKYIKGLEAMKKDMLVDSNYMRSFIDVNYTIASFYYYQDSMSLTIKGNEIQLEKILTTFMTIDFSKNKFRGEIPQVIGTLINLKSLNLSNNSLVGHIPTSIGNLRNLESLDLSSNKLDGTIPTELASLTFLGKLNLSQNTLVGPIPSTNHFDTQFDNSSYQGNLALCGPPLSKKCGPEKSPSLLHEEDDDDDFDRKIILYGYVSGLVIGLSIGYIVFSSELPIWLAKMVQRYRLWKLRGQT